MGWLLELVVSVSLAVVDMLRDVDDDKPKELKRLMEEVNATGGLGARFIESEEEAVATRIGVLVLFFGVFTLLGGETNAAF